MIQTHCGWFKSTDWNLAVHHSDPTMNFPDGENGCYKEYKEEAQCAQKGEWMLVFVICGFIKIFLPNSYFILHVHHVKALKWGMLGLCTLIFQ